MREGERPIIEEVLDYAVYAPLGLAITVAEDLPTLVQRGRARIGTQVGIARFVGKMAAGRARRRIDGLLAPSPEPSSSAAREARTERVDEAAAPRPAAVRAEPAPAEDLGIPGYDTLPASQVVARLGGLAPAELAAVRAYETAHRGRRTILARIDQLEAGRREH